MPGDKQPATKDNINAMVWSFLTPSSKQAEGLEEDQEAERREPKAVQF
jgi:hypothetical protein